MHNIPIINVLDKIIRKAAKVLNRDFYELENLQSSSKGRASYVQKAYEIVKDTLCKELKKAYPDYSIALNEKDYIYNHEGEYRFIINPLDGYQNLARTNPFFATSITLEKAVKDKFEPIACIIDAPILGVIYWSYKGRGAWIERVEKVITNAYRIRASQNDLMKASLVAINSINYKNPELLELISKIESMEADIRVLGSELISGAFVAAGKLDATYFYKPNYANLTAIKLLVNEAGGITFSLKQKLSSTLVTCSGAQYKELFKLFNK